MKNKIFRQTLCTIFSISLLLFCSDVFAENPVTFGVTLYGTSPDEVLGTGWLTFEDDLPLDTFIPFNLGPPYSQPNPALESFEWAFDIPSVEQWNSTTGSVGWNPGWDGNNEGLIISGSVGSRILTFIDNDGCGAQFFNGGGANLAYVNPVGLDPACEDFPDGTAAAPPGSWYVTINSPNPSVDGGSYTAVELPVVVFEDTFDGETTGLGVTTLANWTVDLGGDVDVIGQGSQWDLYPGNGRYLDMDGFKNATIRSKEPINLSPGYYRLSFEIGNNTYGGNGLLVSLGTAFNQSFPAPPTPNPPVLTLITEEFEVENLTTLNLVFQETGPSDEGGTVLDDVKLEFLGPWDSGLDSDNDGVPDDGDNCPFNANPDQKDADGDGLGDVCDQYPNDEDNDTDGDGVPDDIDAFPSYPNESIDTDNDGTGDNSDNCPAAQNADQTNTDGDGLGDACDPDDDNDGVLDADDSAPLDKFTCRDADADTCDDCLSGTVDPANDGTDTDSDGLCDDGDPDDDNDNQSDDDETTCGSDPLDVASKSSDNDSDNVPDCVDADDDNDSVLDVDDAFPFDSSESIDTDGDFIGDNADTDDDNDGCPDLQDGEPLVPGFDDDADTDGDGIPDGCDLCPGEWPESCIEVVNSNPGTPDGEYPICVNNQKFYVYCHDMAGIPQEFITLKKTDGDFNYSSYVPGPQQGDTAAITHFTKLRLDPATLLVDINDLTFASSSGGGFYHLEEQVFSMPYATAMDCVNPDSATGSANVDLTETPFAVSDTFVVYGYLPAGTTTFSANNQIVDLTGGGHCGWNAPGPAQFPAHADPKPVNFHLDLAYIGCNDSDLDCIPDGQDNCPNTPNTNRTDTDDDGLGDECDTDDDNDGVLDADDAFPFDSSESVDTDGDGTGNNADTDDDNDSVPDVDDAFPFDPTETVDTDNDGVGNNADTDDDNDGQSDADETTCGSDSLNNSSTCEVCDGVDNDLDDNIDEGFTDTDSDGTLDCLDACPDDPAKTDPGACGCGIADTDADRDGTPDCHVYSSGFAENIESDSKYAGGENVGWINLEPGGDGGPGVEVGDSSVTGYMWGENIGWISLSCINNDSCNRVNYGVANDGGTLRGSAWGGNVGWIYFPFDENGVKINPATGEFSGHAWGENIGWINFAPNGIPVKTSWRDTDGDGIGNNTDPDDDNDDVTDVNDAFPFDPAESVDTDKDGTGNNADTDDDADGQSDADEIACGSDPLVAGNMSADNDGDNSPDCVDTDDDNDGVLDTGDAFPFDYSESVDTDGDGTGNNADTDDDNDGCSDAEDPAPLVFSADTDNDGQGNDCDTDDDNDGVADADDMAPLNNVICRDLDADSCDDCSSGTDAPLSDGLDTDSDGACNAGDPDDDNDRISDVDEGLCGSDPLISASTCEVCDGTDNDLNDGTDEGFTDTDADGTANCVDTCPNDPNNDGDGDGVCGDVDNCPDVANTSQTDSDGDGLGDLCDTCPADSEDKCDSHGSAAAEIVAEQGGTVQTSDQALTVDIEPGDLAGDTTISVTQTVPENLQADILIGAGLELGETLAVYVLEPDGLEFNNPVTITVKADVTPLNLAQREQVGLYRWDETGNAFVPVEGAVCTTVEDPPGTFIKTCTAQLNHFSIYSMVAPLDSDGDGIFDQFGDVQDNCPMVANADQMNADGDAEGDACDTDDDNDGILDEADNCQYDHNPNQEDFDGDGVGDICDSDVDGDGIVDADDQCLGTEPGGVVDAGGCSITQLCPAERDYRNHGAYVSCVAHAAETFLEAGLITEAEKDAIVSAAAQSDIGKKAKKIFKETKRAVKKLVSLLKKKNIPPATKEASLAAIDELVQKAESLAQIAYDEALTYSGTPKSKELAKCGKEFDKAEKALDHEKKNGTPAPKYEKAIDHYKKAWEHAQKAMRNSPKSDDDSDDDDDDDDDKKNKKKKKKKDD